LIGGSVLRAAVAAGRTAFGYNRSDAGVQAARADGFDASADLDAVLARAEKDGALIVVAVPLPAVAEAFAAIARLAPSCSVTDVVSVKAGVLALARAAGIDHRYVGGHPMSGTAESGWAAGSAELFRGAAWVVDTQDYADAAIWRQVARLALDCGAQVVPADPVEHDEAAARISHLPHVLAETLAIVGADGGSLALSLGAGSFRDGTRVAGTSPALVRAMCEGNREALLDVLREARRLLDDAAEALRYEGSVEILAAAGHAGRVAFDELLPGRIEGVQIGGEGWAARMREAGRKGARLTALD
jgi:prephenate dehydrogenase